MKVPAKKRWFAIEFQRLTFRKLYWMLQKTPAASQQSPEAQGWTVDLSRLRK
jgi:hypothetical protein